MTLQIWRLTLIGICLAFLIASLGYSLLAIANAGRFVYAGLLPGRYIGWTFFHATLSSFLIGLLVAAIALFVARAVYPTIFFKPTRSWQVILTPIVLISLSILLMCGSVVLTLEDRSVLRYRLSTTEASYLLISQHNREYGEHLYLFVCSPWEWRCENMADLDGDVSRQNPILQLNHTRQTLSIQITNRSLVEFPLGKLTSNL
jgi:hypothetical protein